MMMGNTYLFIIPFLMVVSLCLGQDDSLQERPNNRTFALYAIAPSFATGATSSLTGTLIQNGYPRLPRGHFNWGLGGQYRWNRFILGVDLLASYQTRQREDTGSRIVRLAITTNLYTGFYVYRKPGFTLYPYVALSGTDASLYLSRPTAPAPLAGLLATGNTVQLGHFSAGVILGLGIDLQDVTKANSVFESLKVGYRFSPEGAYAWESAFTAISNAPADRFNYWFFQLNLGTAWHWRRNAR